MLLHGTMYQQCSSYLLDFGVLKLLIILNSSDWLRVHSVPNSISMVHHHSANVCHPLMNGAATNQMMGQSINNVHSLLWVLDFETIETLNSFG
jgi:hypothetical protein